MWGGHLITGGPCTGRVGVKTLSGVRRKEARKVDKKNKVCTYMSSNVI